VLLLQLIQLLADLFELVINVTALTFMLTQLQPFTMATRLSFRALPLRLFTLVLVAFLIIVVLVATLHIAIIFILLIILIIIPVGLAMLSLHAIVFTFFLSLFLFFLNELFVVDFLFVQVTF
jgi:hypothetical protein